MMASRRGRIKRLRTYPLVRCSVALDAGDMFDEPSVVHQTESPCYFRGSLAGKGDTPVFCKVWRNRDPNLPLAEAIAEESGMLEITNRGGVPVTKVWSELSATNDCFDGSLFHAVVVSFVEGGMDVS
jgi:hypothetical protein